MIKNFKKLLMSALALPLLAFGSGAVVLVSPVIVGAASTQTLTMQSGADSAQGADQQGNAASLFGQGGQGGIFRTITNVLLFLIGAISVIMLIIGGIRYVVSGGDSTAVQNAKNTILYAIVGVVVAILAYAVVNFVIGSFSGSNS